MIYKIIYFVLLCTGYFIFARTEGIREGFSYFYKVVANIIKDNGEHALFTIDRVFGFGTPFVIASVVALGWKIAIIYCIGIACTFPFLHDNYYYAERHRLDSTIYTKGLNNQSTTSTAISDKKEFFTPIKRDIFFMVGIIFIIFTFILIIVK